jgi:hypothetical protein
VIEKAEVLLAWKHERQVGRASLHVDEIGVGVVGAKIEPAACRLRRLSVTRAVRAATRVKDGLNDTERVVGIAFGAGGSGAPARRNEQHGNKRNDEQPR